MKEKENSRIDDALDNLKKLIANPSQQATQTQILDNAAEYQPRNNNGANQKSDIKTENYNFFTTIEFEVPLQEEINQLLIVAKQELPNTEEQKNEKSSQLGKLIPKGVENSAYNNSNSPAEELMAAFPPEDLENNNHIQNQGNPLPPVIDQHNNYTTEKREIPCFDALTHGDLLEANSGRLDDAQDLSSTQPLIQGSLAKIAVSISESEDAANGLDQFLAGLKSEPQQIDGEQNNPEFQPVEDISIEESIPDDKTDPSGHMSAENQGQEDKVPVRLEVPDNYKVQIIPNLGDYEDAPYLNPVEQILRTSEPQTEEQSDMETSPNNSQDNSFQNGLSNNFANPNNVSTQQSDKALQKKQNQPPPFPPQATKTSKFQQGTAISLLEKPKSNSSFDKQWSSNGWHPALSVDEGEKVKLEEDATEIAGNQANVRNFFTNPTGFFQAQANLDSNDYLAQAQQISKENQESLDINIPDFPNLLSQERQGKKRRHKSKKNAVIALLFLLLIALSVYFWIYRPGGSYDKTVITHLTKRITELNNVINQKSDKGKKWLIFALQHTRQSEGYTKERAEKFHHAILTIPSALHDVIMYVFADNAFPENYKFLIVNNQSESSLLHQIAQKMEMMQLKIAPKVEKISLSDQKLSKGYNVSANYKQWESLKGLSVIDAMKRVFAEKKSRRATTLEALAFLNNNAWIIYEWSRPQSRIPFIISYSGSGIYLKISFMFGSLFIERANIREKDNNYALFVVKNQ